jgi:hypothetical protein
VMICFVGGEVLQIDVEGQGLEFPDASVPVSFFPLFLYKAYVTYFLAFATGWVRNAGAWESDSRTSIRIF